jgi:hypothetical protein
MTDFRAYLECKDGQFVATSRVALDEANLLPTLLPNERCEYMKIRRMVGGRERLSAYGRQSSGD